MTEVDFSGHLLERFRIGILEYSSSMGRCGQCWMVGMIHENQMVDRQTVQSIGTNYSTLDTPNPPRIFSWDNSKSIIPIFRVIN